MTEYQKKTIKQARGPNLKFEGKLLCETRFLVGGRDPLLITYQVWETRGKALIPVAITEPDGWEGDVGRTAEVVEMPAISMAALDNVLEQGGSAALDKMKNDGLQAMRFAVLDFFRWEPRARSMVRQQLGWSMVREIA